MAYSILSRRSESRLRIVRISQMKKRRIRIVSSNPLAIVMASMMKVSTISLPVLNAEKYMVNANTLGPFEISRLSSRNTAKNSEKGKMTR